MCVWRVPPDLEYSGCDIDDDDDHEQGNLGCGASSQATFILVIVSLSSLYLNSLHLVLLEVGRPSIAT